MTFMSDHIRTERRENTFGLDPTVWVLEDGDGGGIEVWPALGFHCYRWFVNLPRWGTQEMLFKVPEFFQQQKPTRSGIPMLFPFPNRIRDGRFHWRRGRLSAGTQRSLRQERDSWLRLPCFPGT